MDTFMAGIILIANILVDKVHMNLLFIGVPFQQIFGFSEKLLDTLKVNFQLNISFLLECFQSLCTGEFYYPSHQAALRANGAR